MRTHLLTGFFSWFLIISRFSADTSSAEEEKSFTREITADSALLNEKNHIIKLDKNVRSDSDGIAFNADHAEVKYDTGFNNLDHALLSGNVFVRTKREKFKADHIEIKNDWIHAFSKKFNLKTGDFCFLKLPGLKMISERISARIENKKITNIDAKNHIYILYNNSLIRADYASMDCKKNLIILRNNIAVLDPKKNLIKCNYCKIDLKGRRYYISGKINGEITL